MARKANRRRSKVNVKQLGVLVLVLCLGVLCGYWLAGRERYVVVHFGPAVNLYRYDVRTGKTWISVSGDNIGWKEVPETNRLLPLPVR